MAVISGVPLLRGVLSGLGALLAVFVVIFALELISGGRVKRYLTRNFRTDMLYGLFYRGGVYNALIYIPLAAGLTAILPDFDLQALRYLPQPLDFVAFWFITDAAGYWIHRWYHTSPILWHFHSVHHAQTELTFVTSFRNHVGEQLVSNVVLFVPMKILGFPLWYWAPIILAQSLFEALQHSDLNWRFGKLYPILVSPVFHAIHHSPDRSRHDSNYGKILSIWDYLFGTLSTGERPQKYGLTGVEMPVSFSGTTLAPFISLWRAWGGRYREYERPL
jgi:sterol desaturase/sphingolipid hydroxylase (fatty acid hydroxylase superfamily)